MSSSTNSNHNPNPNPNPNPIPPPNQNQNQNSNLPSSSLESSRTSHRHARSNSILSSILSLAINPSTTSSNPMTINSITSPTTTTTTTNTPTRPVNSSTSLLNSSPQLDHSPTSTSSSGVSPVSPLNTTSAFIDQKQQNNRRSSIPAFASLTGPFRWPVAPLATTTSSAPTTHSRSISSAPIDPSHPQNTPALLDSTVLPKRRASASSAFRRPFELPNYSRVDEALEEEPTPPQNQRGRSGSLLSSLGSNSSQSSRRKLSPMGERMIRDHPF